MFLENLSITGFKNLEQCELSLSPQLNCFVGSNGSGKTNILDAIHYLSLTKSGVQSTDGRCVIHSGDFFILKGQYGGMDLAQSITISFQPGRGKKVKFGEKDYPRISDHIGRFPLVMITPYHSVLISESAEHRRGFMNAFFSQINPHYMAILMRYNGVLQQRNTLLKSPDADPTLLSVIGQQLSALGHEVFDLRAQYIAELSGLVCEYYQAISGGRESIEVHYNSKLQDHNMAELMAERLPRDMALGYTTAGIHRDDLVFSMDGHPFRAFGSQGQQKSLLIALKLAEARLTSQISGRGAILLLDDVFDKLDSTRVENLVGLVSGGGFGQIFMTDASKTNLRSIAQKFGCDYKIFEVQDGVITQQE